LLDAYFAVNIVPRIFFDYEPYLSLKQLVIISH